MKKGSLNSRDSIRKVTLIICFSKGEGGGADVLTALVTLDLAALYLDLGRNHDAFSAATEVIPIVSRYSHREAIAALAILQEVIQRRRIDVQIVQRVLLHVDLLRKDPLSAIASRQAS